MISKTHPSYSKKSIFYGTKLNKILKWPKVRMTSSPKCIGIDVTCLIISFVI